MADKNKLKLTVVVNGTPTELEENLNAPLTYFAGFARSSHR